MKRVFTIFIIFFITLSIFLSIIAIKFNNIIYSSIKSATPQQIFYAEDFGIERVLSNTDFDNDGIDDYTDILEGARLDAIKKPKYRSAYYENGYPPDDEGVCSDVIWRALKNAGYSLKDMIDEDIKKNVDKYPRVEGKPDPNIDFRRVANLTIYFKRNHISLTIDLNEIDKWQAGDIVVFSNDHIGIISDKRNEKGVPYIIHNGGQNNREEDGLEFYNNNWKPITAHYRLKDLNTNENN